jgi:DUF971 family protein
MSDMICETPKFKLSADDIRVLDDGQYVAISEADGAVIHIPAAALRNACRCAWCSQARRQDAFQPAGSKVTISDAELHGPAILHLIFSDGHRTGLFPFSFLLAIAADMRPTKKGLSND